MKSPPNHGVKIEERNRRAVARTKLVATLMLNGLLDTKEIFNAVKLKGFKCNYNNVAKDKSLIIKAWRAAHQAEAEASVDIHAEQLMNIFRRQMAAEDYGEARKTLESDRKLRGLDAPEKKEVGLDFGVGESDLTNAALKKVAARFLAND